MPLLPTPDMLRRLAYVSRPAADLAPGEIARIIRLSRVRNPEKGITGTLVFAGNEFVQWLEGSAGAVEALWSSIRNDPRHDGIVVLLDHREREVGHFKDWRAGFPADAEMAFAFQSLREAGRALEPGEVASFRALLQRCDVT